MGIGSQIASIVVPKIREGLAPGATEQTRHAALLQLFALVETIDDLDFMIEVLKEKERLLLHT